MIFQIKFSESAKRDSKKNLQLLKEIKKRHLSKIARNPKLVERKLSGVLKDFWSYHFHFSGTQYRIIYEIFEKEIVIVVIAIGKREKIYGRIQRKI